MSGIPIGDPASAADAPAAPPVRSARATAGVSRHVLAILLTLTLLGGLWRVASFRFNIWPHGDVVLDAAIAESVAQNGRLLVPIVDVRYYPIGRFGFGYPPDQHPPLWPLLGAPLVWLAGDGYTALKLVGLLVGLLVIPLSYLALRRHVGSAPALYASGLAAASYPLVDFSGNGSLWILLAALYLGWLWALPVEAGEGGLPSPPGPGLPSPPGPELPSPPGPLSLGAGEGENPGLGSASPSPASRERGPGGEGSPAPRERGPGGRGDLGAPWLVEGSPGDCPPSRFHRAGLTPRWALLGLVMGLAYLTNYPAIVLPVALAALHLLRHGRQALQPIRVAGPALSALVMLVVVSPWLLYNVALFGSPVWSQPFQRTLAGGSRQVEYAIVDGEVVKRNLPANPDRLAGLRERALDLYGNVGFVAKQSLALTPVLGGLFLVGLLLLVPPVARRPSPFAPHRPAPPTIPGAPSIPTAPQPPLSHAGEGGRLDGTSGPLAVAVLALVHLALVIWWPTTKFRYLIPLLPLVFGIGAWCLWQLGPPGLRARLAIVTAGLCLFTNAWTMLSIPSRTYYYDGGLVTDNFGQQGERLFVEDARRLRAAADAIVARGPGVVLGDHILAPFTRLPLVVNSTGYPPHVVEHLVRQYRIRYIVTDRAHADAYAFLQPAPLWSDDRLTVLELPPR